MLPPKPTAFPVGSVSPHARGCSHVERGISPAIPGVCSHPRADPRQTLQVAMARRFFIEVRPSISDMFFFVSGKLMQFTDAHQTDPTGHAGAFATCTRLAGNAAEFHVPPVLCKPLILDSDTFLRRLRPRVGAVASGGCFVASLAPAPSTKSTKKHTP